MHRIFKTLGLLIIVNCTLTINAQEFDYKVWKESLYNRDKEAKYLSLFIQNNKLITFQKSDSEIYLDIKTKKETLNSIYFFGGKINKTDSLPKAIGLLSNLYYIDLLNKNESLYVPKDIGKLKKLEYLGISSNFIKGSLPDEIGTLNQLIYLGLLSDSDLFLTRKMFRPLSSIVYIELKGKFINKIPGSLFNNKSVKGVSIKADSIGEWCIEKLKQKSLNDLSIDLDCNQTLPKELSAIDVKYLYLNVNIEKNHETIKKWESVEELRFGNCLNSLTDEFIAILDNLKPKIVELFDSKLTEKERSILKEKYKEIEFIFTDIGIKGG